MFNSFVWFVQSTIYALHIYFLSTQAHKLQFLEIASNPVILVSDQDDIKQKPSSRIWSRFPRGEKAFLGSSCVSKRRRRIQGNVNSEPNESRRYYFLMWSWKSFQKLDILRFVKLLIIYLMTQGEYTCIFLIIATKTSKDLLKNRLNSSRGSFLHKH